jgi:hypothetical protein
MLGTFLLAQEYKKEEFIGYIAIGNMLMATSLVYYPKLIFVYIPVSLFIFRLLEKHSKHFVIKK